MVLWPVMMPIIHIHAEPRLIRGDIPPLPHTPSCLFDYCPHGILMLNSCYLRNIVVSISSAEATFERPAHKETALKRIFKDQDTGIGNRSTV